MSSKKGGIHFFKTTVIGGLVFLVPVVVLVLISSTIQVMDAFYPVASAPSRFSIHYDHE